MVFDWEKFDINTEEDVCNILEEACVGFPMPSFVMDENGKVLTIKKHLLKFPTHIRKSVTLSRRPRRKCFHIVCPENDEIYIEYKDKMDMEEVKLASDKILNFLTIMSKYGFIVN